MLCCEKSSTFCVQSIDIEPILLKVMVMTIHVLILMCHKVTQKSNRQLPQFRND